MIDIVPRSCNGVAIKKISNILAAPINFKILTHLNIHAVYRKKTINLLKSLAPITGKWLLINPFSNIYLLLSVKSATGLYVLLFIYLLCKQNTCKVKCDDDKNKMHNWWEHQGGMKH